MRSQDLFAAIGGVESFRLERSEQHSHSSSRNEQEEPNMKRKHIKKHIRYLLLAAVITALLTVTAYAAIQSRIRMDVQKYQNDHPVTDAPTGNYDVEIDFQRTSNEYLELGSVYPRQVPEAYQLSFISDTVLGFQTLRYTDAAGEEAIYFAVQLGSDGQQFRLKDVANEEAVTIGEHTGTLYHHENGSQTIAWQDEAQGFGFTIHGYSAEMDLLAIARSVGPGEPLTPTRAAGKESTLAELGDYRITALPDGFTETDFMASPLEDGGGWYAYVRRWYGDKITTDNTIYFEYEHFQLESDEPTNHPAEPVENKPETILQYKGGGEPSEVQGMPAAVSEDSVIWVNWDAQVVFKIVAPGRSAQELLALAESVKNF